MKNLNLFRKSARGSEGSTLASAVVRPSFDRRLTVVKHLAFMLLFLLGSLNVWGDEEVYKTALFGSSYNSKGVSAYTGVSFSSTNEDFTVNVTNANNNNSGWEYIKIGGKKGAYTGTITTSAAIDKAITKVALTIDAITASNVTSITLKTSTDGSSWVDAGTFDKSTGAKQVTITSPMENLYYQIEAVCTQGSSNGLLTISKVEFYAEKEETSDPTVSVTPESWDFGNVAKSAAASKEFTIAGSNLTGNLTFSVTGGYTLSANGATVSEGSVNTTLTVSKNINTTGANNGTLTISGGGLDPSKTVGLTMTIVEDPEPTGTFELFSGDLEEGDYVICSGTTALKNALATNTNYIGYESVEVNNDEVENPSNDLVWHIAQSGEYWTIYNVTANNYAASTGAKNKGQVIADGTDDKAKWTVSGNSSYEFVNKANTAASVNSNLRYNSGYGFACYSTSTGSSLSLYKKQVAGQPKAPTFSVEGGNYESAQSVELSCETEGATIYYTTNGDAPTSSSTQYNGTAITVDHTMTIKAIAIKNEISSTVASATYTIIVWQTVADVWDNIVVGGPKNAHVYGYVSQTNVGGYANNFYISDNGSTEGNQLYAYRMDMNSFSVEVGDKVKLAGDLTNHQGTKEFEYANQGATQGRVIALEAKGAVTSVAVSGNATKTTYSANETFETAGLVVTATYANGFSEVVTEGITWGDDLTDHKVAESTTVQVTATVGGVISAAYGVAIEVSTKALVSIALSADEFEVYQGLELPKPTVTATYSEGDPEDVTALAEFTGYDKTTPGEQTITVSYSFGGGDPIEETYTVTVKPIYNVELPASVAKGLIETAVGETESTEDMIVRGIVSHINNASNNVQTYWISDDGTRTNEVEIFKGKYLSGANFTTTNQLKVGDEVVVKGKVVYYNSTTPEFANGKSQLQSLARTPNFVIEAVTGFEVGSANLAVADLTITRDGEGAVTLESSDKEEFVTIEGGKLHAVAPGTATITANLAADGIYKAATYEFSVTVIAAQVKYAITFDGNGADGGEAPEAIANKAAGAEVTLPANAYTKTGHTFNGWKVINNTTSEEVEVVAGVFTMPASAVTIQAKWAEISVWATTYTSNVTLTAGTGAQAAKVRFTADGEQYDAVKAGTGKAGGSITVTVPAQATKLHLHVAGWTGENPTISITAPEGVTVTPASISATEDEGMNSNSPYTLQNNPVEQYLVLSLEGNTEEIQLTFSIDAGNKRFVLFGVNQEGGSVPVLDRIEISGDLTNKSGYKAGDDLNMEGLTVNAIYTLNEVEQDPVDVTADVEWSYDALVENQTEVTVTATYGEKHAQKTITDLEPVASADPKIYVDKLSVNFGTVAPNASVDAQTITVTLTNVANATATLGGTNPGAFSITPASPAALTTSGDITISVVSTANVGTYSATITISDDAEAATSKVVNLSLIVEDVETPVSTTSKWVAATEIADGVQVLIVGEDNGTFYAMSEDRGNNRGVVAGTIKEDVFTPGAQTMAFTLVAQDGGTYALRASNGKYLYAGGTGNSNWLNTKAYDGELDANAKWNIDLANSTIIATSSNRNEMRFNKTNNPKIISCYQSSSTSPTVALYVPKPAEYETVRSGLEINRHYTVCLPKNITHIKGATFWNLQYKNAGNTEVYLVEETAPGAGKPYIIQATDTKLEVVYGEEIAANPVENGALRGTFTGINETDFAALEGTVYLLINNAIRPRTVGNYLDANRAYVRYDLLTVPQTQNFAPGKRVRAIPMQQNTATGMENVQGDNVQCTKVLINGQLYIMYNGTMYNVQGQLVK